MSAIHAALTHSQFQQLLMRVHHTITNNGWPVDSSLIFHPWRHTPEEYLPPFAFSVGWRGGALSQDQEDWLCDHQAFGHVQHGCLFIYDMTPQPKPTAMFHATPAERVESILASGLKPGRLTGVSTTNFLETHRWIHLFESVQHATDRWLLLSENSKLIPAGTYTILRVESEGIDELLCDPFSVHGFVTRADVIQPEFITPQHNVVVPKP